MSKKFEKSLFDRAYSKGRRAKFIYGNVAPLYAWYENDMQEIGGNVDNQFMFESWKNGFNSKDDHNPLPKPTKFADSSVLRQKIRYKGRVRGIVITYVKNTTIFIGYSLCNPIDRYNDELGFLLARARAVPISKFTFKSLPEFDNRELDRVVRETVSKTLGRALNYFQQARLSFPKKNIPDLDPVQEYYNSFDNTYDDLESLY